MEARYRWTLAVWALATAGLLVLLSADGLPVGWPLLVVASVFAADAGSYVFHYLVDHYGTPRPGGVVYEFQCHHLRPDGIVEKPVAEILYPAVRWALPLELLMSGLHLGGVLSPGLGLVLLTLAACWVGAQLFHRWAHRPAGPWVAGLQRLGLLVRPLEHAKHHRAPFDRRFAVVSGWSDFVLDGMGAPRLLDALMRRLGFRKRGLVHSLKCLGRQESTHGPATG
jgi:ubiquitin-conjugating enzyme E2 variant